MTCQSALRYLTATGAAVHLTGSGSSSCLSSLTRSSVPSAVVPPRHAATWPLVLDTFLTTSRASLPGSPREQLFHRVAALLLNLDREVSLKIRWLQEVVGLIWGSRPRRHTQRGCSSTVTGMRPSNKLLQLKPPVGLGGLTLVPLSPNGRLLAWPAY